MDRLRNGNLMALAALDRVGDRGHRCHVPTAAPVMWPVPPHCMAMRPGQLALADVLLLSQLCSPRGVAPRFRAPAGPHAAQAHPMAPPARPPGCTPPS